MKEDRRRRLKTQLALNSLNARRKRVLNFACLLLLLISQRNITVPRPVCTCRRLKRNTGCWENVCNTSSKERFKKTFRVSPKTFIFILNCIEPFPIRQTVNRQRSAKPEACYFFLYRLGRRDYLYTMAMHDNVRTSHLHCLLDLPGSLSSPGGPFMERNCVKSHASNWRRVQTKNSWHGTILAISSLLDSNKWLPYSYGMLAWRTSGMQRVPSFSLAFLCLNVCFFMMNTGLK